MAKLVWDEAGTRLYETGTKKGVLYLIDATTKKYTHGYAWPGLTAVTESPSGAESTKLYADDIKYLDLRSAEEFGATVEAYTYPEEFGVCDGSTTIANGVYVGQQKRQPFGFCYRTTLGNDTELDDYGYKLHLIYNATASPSERAYQTINDSPEAISFSWEISTTPIPFLREVTTGTGSDAVTTTEIILHNGKELKPVACITIDSTKVAEAKLTLLENKLYGTTSTDPELPLPGEVYDLFNAV